MQRKNPPASLSQTRHSSCGSEGPSVTGQEAEVARKLQHISNASKLYMPLCASLLCCVLFWHRGAIQRASGFELYLTEARASSQCNLIPPPASVVPVVPCLWKELCELNRQWQSHCRLSECLFGFKCVFICFNTLEYHHSGHKTTSREAVPSWRAIVPSDCNRIPRDCR